MNPAGNAALGGFEERLLTKLKAHIEAAEAVAHQPQAVPATEPSVRRRRRYRSLASAAAAATTALLAVVNLIPASQMTLAEAFPILTHQTHALPGFLRRVLRSQGVGARLDLQHAYTFQTPTGTGYVVLERGARWLCIVVPGFGHAHGGAHCVTITQNGQTDSPLRLTLTDNRHAREEIVQLLPAGATAATDAGHRTTRRIDLRNGILAVMVHGSTTITTTINGHQSATTYSPAQPNGAETSH